MAPREDELEAATGCLDDSPRVEAAEAAAAAEPPAADLPPPPADLSPPPRAPPPPIHTSGGSLPSPRPSYGTPPEEDGWTASGPFRAAPLTHVLHAASTPPSGTPQASPRHSGPEPDLEAPLLGGGGARQRAAKQAFGLAGGDGSGGAALAIKACVFGLINTAAGIPALIAFCAVVFKDPLYRPFIDPLCKFFYLSSAVHQAVVSARSAVPHAVGQVQDVGLIFLSAMATSIAAACTRAGLDAAAALGTTLLTLAASTALVGLGLMAVARLRLAGAVNFVPLPAVGGYLGYVGYFCLASGLGLGCGIQLGSPASWLQLWDAQVALRVLPTLGSTALLMWTMARCRHPLALPGVLAAIVLAFHAALLALGVTLQEAQEAGWVLKPAAASGNPFDLWRLFDVGPGLSLANLHLPAMFQQAGKLAGLFLLVAFGSCMDIAAIQSDCAQRLDFNRELGTIGLSNLASGAVGAGITGSFIFSQTIFTGRAGVHSRLNGVVIAACELALFALPVSIVQYAPCFFFGSLLVWFGVEIVLDWMVRSARKLSHAEYALLWATFACIFATNLEAGIAAGCVLATLWFAWGYARSQLSTLAPVPGRSRIVRAADQEAALELLRPSHLASVQLRGWLWFGTAASVSSRLHEAAQALESGLGGAADSGCGGGSGGGSPAALAAGARAAASQHHADRLYADSSKHGGALFAAVAAPRFLLLDLGAAKGLDATAARTLAALFRDLAQLDITPVVTAAGHSGIRQLLLAHGAPLPPAPAATAEEAAAALAAAAAAAAEQADEGEGGGVGAPPPCFEFSSREEGLRFAEQQLLAVACRYGLCRPASAAVPLADMLASHASQAGLPFARKEEAGAAAAQILRHATKHRLRPGDRLWAEGEPAGALYIVEQGRLTVEQRVAGAGSGGAAAAAAAAGEQQQQQQQQGSSSCGGGDVRVFEFGPGCAAGVVDCYLHRARSSSAYVGAGGGCRCLRLSREALGRMAAEAPDALHLLQAVLLRAKCLDLGTAAELAVA